LVERLQNEKVSNLFAQRFPSIRRVARDRIDFNLGYALDGGFAGFGECSGGFEVIDWHRTLCSPAIDGRSVDLENFGKFDVGVNHYLEGYAASASPCYRPASGAAYKITCDWRQRTATVIYDFVDINGLPQESREIFKITNFNIQNVCLMRIDGNGGVDVITMSAEIGSFIETISNAPGFLKKNGRTIWYGTCRN
jgi:hypothetical protein